MKKALGWTVAWAIFWIGHGFSRVIDYWPTERGHPYWMCSRIMLKSVAWQDWGGSSGPWSAPSDLHSRPS